MITATHYTALTQYTSALRNLQFPVPTSSTSTTTTSNITVYDLHITSSTPPLLCISGTHGITIISYASLSSSFTTLSPPPPGLSVPTIPNPKVLHTFHPHPSSSESSPIEVNCVSSHPSRPSLIYAACGDQFGVYEFDVQASRLVREMGGGGGGYQYLLWKGKRTTFTLVTHRQHVDGIREALYRLELGQNHAL